MIPDRIKAHISRHKTAYSIGVIVVVAGVTYIVTRRFSTQPLTFAKKIVIKDSVILIKTYERHQGPPSWMIRSGDQLWRSQTAAAKAVGVSKATMSQHLNGNRPHINGRVFERVAIEIGRKG